MPAEFPLWRSRPEEAARIIIMAPQEPVEKHKFWRKREMRIRPSKRSEPRADDDKFLAKAANGRYWSQYTWEHANEFPIIGVMLGPLLRDGGFFSLQPIHNALLSEREREPWGGMYSRKQYDADVAYLEETRALLRENFLLGQRKEGPYLDGVIFMRTDNLLVAEQLRCKHRLQMTWALIEASRAAKGKRSGSKERQPEHWQNIGVDEAVAMKFKQAGHKIRKIDTLTNRHYEVKVK